MTDIVFDDPEEQITMLCDLLRVQGHDIFLDSPERRKTPAGGPALRRALVHDQNDGLTLNFSHDYPGGITLQGVRTLEFKISHRDEPDIRHGGHPPDETVILDEVIKTLRKEIEDLQNRVATLEQNH